MITWTKLLLVAVRVLLCFGLHVVRKVLPGLALVESLYTALLAHGRGRLGTQSLVLALAQLANHPWPPPPPAQVS